MSNERRDKKIIISLHNPKTGGSSFKDLLQSHFKSRFKGDYHDIPINKSIEKRSKEAEQFRIKYKYILRFLYRTRQIKCIHGHFLPYKYNCLNNNKDVLFVTWLRDPIDRIASHYYYWQRSYNTKSAPLHKKVVENNWSLEEFAFSKEMKNIYDQFLWRFPKERFEFIGITEHFEQDLIYFASRYLGVNDIEPARININEKKDRPYFNDKKIVEELKNFHSRDYLIYNYALEKRQRRLDKYQMRLKEK